MTKIYCEERREKVRPNLNNQSENGVGLEPKKIKEPRAKKGGVKGKAKSEEELKLEKIKIQSKERAQKSRERKRRYTEDLETKIDILERQVKYLTLELDKYKKFAMKSQISINQNDKNIQEEQTMLIGVLNHLQSSTNSSIFSNVHQEIASKEGVKGKNRMNLIDKAMKVIMDSLIPDTYALGFYFTQLEPESKRYINPEKIKKARNYSKYQIQEAVSKGEFND